MFPFGTSFNRNIVPEEHNKVSLGSSVKKLLSIFATTVTSDLVGNVTGNLTGNVTGNVTGVVTGAARRLYQTQTSVGLAANTSEQSLHAFTIPAGTLAANGDAIHLRTWYQAAANANTKYAKIVYGATTIMDSTDETYNNIGFIVEAMVFRISATVQKALVSAYQPNVNVTYATAAGGGFNISAPAETLSGTVVIDVRAQSDGGAANDWIALATVIDYLPAV